MKPTKENEDIKNDTGPFLGPFAFKAKRRLDPPKRTTSPFTSHEDRLMFKMEQFFGPVPTVPPGQEDHVSG